MGFFEDTSMNRIGLRLVLLVLVTLPISCTSYRPRIIRWQHDDEWDTRVSKIAAWLDVPDGHTIDEIQIRLSRIPRDSPLIGFPAVLVSPEDGFGKRTAELAFPLLFLPGELLSDGDGIRARFAENAFPFGDDVAFVDLISRSWGDGDQLGEEFLQNGDQITFSLVINYTNSLGISLTATDGPHTYTFGHLAEDIYRTSTRRDGDTSAPEFEAVAITGGQGSHVQTTDDGAASFQVGDEVLLISMQGNNAGQYHLGIVGSNTASETDNGRDFTLCERYTPPGHSTGSGYGDYLEIEEFVPAFEFLNACEPLQNTCCLSFSANTKIQMVKIFHYDDVLVRNGDTLSVPAWDGTKGGVMFFRANSVLVERTGSIDVSGKGFGGALSAGNGLSGLSGESYRGPVQAFRQGGAGGGAQTPCEEYDCEDRVDPDSRPTIGPGGGGAGYGGFGTSGIANESNFLPQFSPGDRGFPYGKRDLSELFLGAGGGGGGGGIDGPAEQDSGGTGGGILVVTAGTMRIMGEIRSKGVGGSTNHNTMDQDGNCVRERGSGESGGGAGGTIWLAARYLLVRDSNAVAGNTANPNIRADGGSNRCRLGGGAGGVGRTRLDYRFIQGIMTGGTATTQLIEEGAEEANELIEGRTHPKPSVVGGF
ncbi:MAG: hypothetical protein BMS9Abin29_0790 [Gemmatimonadota bacterium]|nr:MAG: hypothetical protein BMS9Abin29_0790 [Gemmatimonadota bacterium]